MDQDPTDEPASRFFERIGFHNLGGGYLVIGVEEANGRPVLPPKGIDPERVDAMQKELLRLGHQAIQPTFHPLSAPYAVDGRTGNRALR